MTSPDVDARPPVTEAEEVARLRGDLEDLRTTLMARAARRPTGDIEATLRTTPKPDSVFVQGQTLQRADYPALWAWINDQTPGGFSTTGSTLTLPDWRGRTPVGATAARPVGTLFGTQSNTLTVANMPSHDHGSAGNHNHYVSVDSAGNHNHYVSVDSAGNHNHYFSTSADGSHGGHIGSSVTRADGNFGTAAHPAGVGGGNHGHDGTTAGNGTHSHAGTSAGNGTHSHDGTSAGNGTHAHAAQGSGTPFNTEDPAISVNWLLWI